MYYWSIAYTYCIGHTAIGVHDKIETETDTYVASNFTAAMEAFMESIRLRFPPGVNVCDIAIVRGPGPGFSDVSA